MWRVRVWFRSPALIACILSFCHIAATGEKAHFEHTEPADPVFVVPLIALHLITALCHVCRKVSHLYSHRRYSKQADRV